MRFLNSTSPVIDVISQLDEVGIVPFTDMTTHFDNYYHNKLKPVLNKSITQSYTNHPAEGYFFFLYDFNRFSQKEVVDLIFENVQ